MEFLLIHALYLRLVVGSRGLIRQAEVAVDLRVVATLRGLLLPKAAVHSWLVLEMLINKDLSRP
jgi:hypothetical protein